MSSKKRNGRVVETIKGVKGIVYEDDLIINNLVLVYLDNKMQMLCNPDKLKTIGYVD